MDYNTLRYAIIDIEVGANKHKILDIGALRHDGAIYHSASREGAMAFLAGTDYLCGHNIVHHDAKYLFGDMPQRWRLVDTLYMSPLLFPERPYHKLLKDDKLMTEQLNNPVNDCEKARDLLWDEVAQWKSLPEEKRGIMASLLKGHAEFDGFLAMAGAVAYIGDLPALIRETYAGKICLHANLPAMIEHYPCALAYALAIIDTRDHRSVTPGWVLHNYPEVEYIMRKLRHTRCAEGCPYCRQQLDLHQNLERFFGYKEFRTYEGEKLQEMAAQAAADGQSLLAIFPTGGGKSLTFQLPALMEGRTVHGLTIVISPLQSLMKDQVDNLAQRGIADAVTINGMLDPITRKSAIEQVLNGDASLLYISPEMLRSRTIERILTARQVVRFVIDEAHCFSSWGQDFRVDYLYIGKFIRDYQQRKGLKYKIPVSCFTATAKQKVIQDICDYFKRTLDLDLQLFASKATRTNLHYAVIHADTDEDKYQKLRSLIAESQGPAIVYVSRTKRTIDLAMKLTRDGFPALPFNGKMAADKKIENQEAFMQGHVRIIVATSAFGMGVDKKDVGLVIHYDISDSLENYVQESGRAGRDPHLEARCFVLYSDNDLDKHFILLNQTKLSLSEIQQVWKAIKSMTRQRDQVNCSALEIARAAGWGESGNEIETRVKTALATLEQGGYIERGNNMPQVFATSISVKNVDEARQKLEQSALFGREETEASVRIIKSLISQKYVAKGLDTEAESRVDYLADTLGMTKSEVVSAVNRMRQAGILADHNDISAYLQESALNASRVRSAFEKYARLEQYIVAHIPDETLRISYKQLNDNAANEGISTANEKSIRTLLYFLSAKGYVHRDEDATHIITLMRQANAEKTMSRMERRHTICRIAIDWIYAQQSHTADLPETAGRHIVQFSTLGLLKRINDGPHDLFSNLENVSIEEVEEALLYLSAIGALKLEGGFLVLYNAMNIHRLKDNKSRYKQDDYRMLNEFYKQKIQQIHIVGEYANLMVEDYDAALQYVKDYFQMDYRRFIAKYFKGDRMKDIQRNVSPAKYDKIFGSLSTRQREIVNRRADEGDAPTRCTIVAAGPGSGKTRVLVHKLASLLMMEDVKHDQLLMLTFSRAAANEFKQRLIDLVGNAAHFVEIKTFHSYCFDLLGRIGNLDDAKDVVARATKLINQGEVEPTRIAKTVLVIDEAQDMSEAEYSLVKALIDKNEEMHVIAVGDDDQNIYAFRGSNSDYMFQLLRDYPGQMIEMTENYRSSKHIVGFANGFARQISHRHKTTPIVSMSKDDGQVRVTRHTTKNMYQAVVDDLMRHRRQGTTAILTRTNEEALTLATMLRSCGVNGKLIQSPDDFAFGNLAEMRHLLKGLDRENATPLITDQQWEQCKAATFKAYEDSDNLQYVKRCIATFERLNPKKYRTDFHEFVYESSLEDFSDLDGGDVIVSTIHKSKGREYDEVYMLLSGDGPCDSEQMRCYYVGMTRAKRQLSIHTTSDCFANLGADTYQVDATEYDLPKEITLQLTFRDVYLNFFKERKAVVLAVRSGQPLQYGQGLLYSADMNAVASLSTRMRKTLSSWTEKGYQVSSATAKFIVAWRPKDEPDAAETAILLPELTLSR